MKTTSKIAKGKILENWLVERLRLSGLDTRAYRQKGSGSGKNKGDIWNDLGLCIEAKNQKRFNPQWFRQVKRETMVYEKSVLVYHAPQSPLDESKVIIDWMYFEELLKKSREPQTTNPDKTAKYKLARLIQAAKEVVKELE